MNDTSVTPPARENANNHGIPGCSSTSDVVEFCRPRRHRLEEELDKARDRPRTGHRDRVDRVGVRTGRTRPTASSSLHGRCGATSSIRARSSWLPQSWHCSPDSPQHGRAQRSPPLRPQSPPHRDRSNRLCRGVWIPNDHRQPHRGCERRLLVHHRCVSVIVAAKPLR